MTNLVRTPRYLGNLHQARSNPKRLRLWLWCYTPLSTTSQLYRGALNFIGGGNWSLRRKFKWDPWCSFWPM